jgi:hypothetical protein
MQLMADRPLVTRAGTHTVHLSVVRPGVFRVEVRTPGPVALTVEDLTRSYDDERLARTIARVITIALRKPDATVEDARRAVVQHLDAEMEFLAENPSVQAARAVAVLQGLKAGFETEDETRLLDELATDMAAFLDAVFGVANTQSTLAGNGDNPRSAQVTGQPQTMAETVPAGEHRQVPPTAAGAHHVAPSEPLTRIVDTAASLGGTILRSKSANARQLRALARKGLVTLTYRPGSSRPDPISATLTAQGWRQARTVVPS